MERGFLGFVVISIAMFYIIINITAIVTITMIKVITITKIRFILKTSTSR